MEIKEPGKAEVVQWDGGTWFVQIPNVGIVFFECTKDISEFIAKWFNDLREKKPKDMSYEEINISLKNVISHQFFESYTIFIEDIGFVGPDVALHFFLDRVILWYPLFLAKKESNKIQYLSEKLYEETKNNEKL